MRVHDLLRPECVRIPLHAREKESLLRELVSLAVRAAGLEAEEESVYRAIWDRENVLSTGIGEGIAIPHARYPGLDRIVMAAGVSREAVDFEALDGRPVNLFFLVLGPENATGGQIRVLSRISRLLRDPDLRGRLAAAETGDEFLQALEEAERRI